MNYSKNRLGAKLDKEHKKILRDSNIKKRKVLMVHKSYEDDMDSAIEFNSTYELVEYLINSNIVENNNKSVVLINVLNVANGLAKNLNRSLKGYRIFIEGINFYVDEDGDYLKI